jgi:hypothetical protein
MKEEKVEETIEPEVVDEAEEEEARKTIPGKIPILSTEAFKFAQLVAEGVGPTEAYRRTYPDKVERLKNLRVAAYTLAHNPKVREQIAILQEAVRLQLITEAPAAFERIKQLSESASGEKVKLEANLQILDRAGLKPPQRVEQIQIGLWGSLSTQDMRELVKRRLENQ